jgi:DNA-binding HxlR family transcriptional regulator
VERNPPGTVPHARITDVTSGLDAAMAAVGDRWTLLVVDALLDGPRRFSELQEAIPKVAPNVLTARLRSLAAQGLVVGSRYSDRPPRLEYRVTEAGRDLAGALRLLSRWGARDTGGEVEGPHHRSCGTSLETRWYCPTCARVTEQADDDLRWV